MMIPRTIDRTNEVSKNRTNRHIGRQTVENRANKSLGENCLLPKVQIIRDLWGVWAIGPWFRRRVRHGSDVFEGKGRSKRREKL